MTKRSVINHGGLSGGKDSTLLMLVMINGLGYPRESLDFTFCNTGNEHPFTLEYIKWLSETVFPITEITPPLDFYDLARKKRRFPSAKARFCTEELKIKPTQAYIAKLQEGGADVILHTGVRRGESKERAQLKERDFDTLYDCEVVMPRIGLTRSEVFEKLFAYGVPPNPLYGLTETLPWSDEPNPYFGDGMYRVGCWPCCMSRKQEVGKIATKTPERIIDLGCKERSVTRGDGTAISTFFARDKVPKYYRTMEYVRPSDGKVFHIAPIESVAKWAITGKGGHQMQLPMLPPDDYADEPLTCAAKWGLCE